MNSVPLFNIMSQAHLVSFADFFQKVLLSSIVEFLYKTR